MKIIKLPAELKGYKLVEQPPLNPCTIAMRLVDFTSLSEEDAEYLVSKKCPYIQKIEVSVKTDIVAPTAK
jgi:hypothetical protein